MQLQLIASPRKFLHVLLWLRVCAIVNQSVTIVVIERWLGIALPEYAMSAAIAALAVAALLTGLRLQAAVPVTQLEVSLQLLIDIAELTVLLCLSGGASNPFTSLYLIPVALSAVGLRWQYTAIITVICLGCYAFLIVHCSDLTFTHMSAAGAFDLHMVGMHVTFPLSAALLAAALSMTAAEMRRRDVAMATLRENVMRKEHLSAMGVLAAGTAHELSTPLLSMALLVSELRAARRRDREFHDNLDLLDKQIGLCKRKLTTLLQTAGNPRSPQKRSAPITTVLREVLDSWSIIRPATRLEVDWQDLAGNPSVTLDEGFPQALISLLDNAAEASEAMGSDLVRVIVTGDTRHIRLYIDDEGPGLNTEVQQRAGKAVFTTKNKGFGLGLMLSHANLHRLSGELTLSRRPEGGTRTTVTMPLRANEAVSGDG
jgi:two-component system sensor histidine kinase RegB